MWTIESIIEIVLDPMYYTNKIIKVIQDVGLVKRDSFI